MAPYNRHDPFLGLLGPLVLALYVCKTLTDVNEILSLRASTRWPRNSFELFLFLLQASDNNIYKNYIFLNWKPVHLPLRFVVVVGKCL